MSLIASSRLGEISHRSVDRDALDRLGGLAVSTLGDRHRGALWSWQVGS
jgi:hypothetical protein